MSKERMMILEMLESGKITPADAQVLLQALGEDQPGDMDATPLVEDSHPLETVLRSEVSQPAEAWQPRPEPQPASEPRSVIGAISQIFSKPSAPARDRRRRYPDPSYAVAMKRSGLDFSIEQLFRLQEGDIEPEQAIKMVRESRPEWTSDDIVEMLTQGACPDVLSKLNELGFDYLTPRDVIQLTEHDVDSDYLEGFRGINITGLTVRDLIEFADNEVDPDLALAMMEFGPATPRDIVEASNNDLSPSFVRRIAQFLPAANTGVRQLIELAEHDVSEDFIEALVRGGFINLTIKQIIKLQENDVDPRDAVWFREKLGEHITPDDLLRLAQHDVSRDYVKSLLKFNLPDLTVAALIEMYDHDVSAEDVAEAKQAFGDDITVADLIDIADNR